MQPFEIYIAYAPWGSTGKVRPVLVRMQRDGAVFVYRITTQHKAKFFIINDWQQAGLDKLSYVDTGVRVKLSQSTFEDKAPIGKLSDNDKMRLMQFLGR